MDRNVSFTLSNRSADIGSVADHTGNPRKGPPGLPAEAGGRLRGVPRTAGLLQIRR